LLIRCEIAWKKHKNMSGSVKKCVNANLAQ
jgi:hypothetical protein